MSNPLETLWQKIVGGRAGRQDRRAERSVVRVPVKARILGTEFKMDEVRYAPALAGYTQTLSEIGLSLILPSARVEGLDLSGRYRRLKIALDLPSHPIEIFATTVYFKRLRKEDGPGGCLIGARITKISPQDSQILKTYLITSH